ncbi:hypothetical protein EWM64_g8011 [Hericium alpestre]|uniref:Uncharacterized protein n=1 Tax=Hericium alpestre TaxID=135208 RepID=A0A4Y9ZQA0_9AGAM|nr:hypothetical protein EWM64_g8011 [Hericium alpestre]
MLITSIGSNTRLCPSIITASESKGRWGKSDGIVKGEVIRAAGAGRGAEPVRGAFSSTITANVHAAADTTCLVLALHSLDFPAPT